MGRRSIQRDAWGIAGYAVLGIVILAALVLGLASCASRAAEAHQYCVGPECARISSATVIEVPGEGWFVTVMPGGHPMWGHDRAERLSLPIFNLDTHPSPDGLFRLCLDRNGRATCFHAPTLSF